MSSRLAFQLIIGLLLLVSGSYQVMTGGYLPFQRIGLGAPRSPVAIRVLGILGVVVGFALVILALVNVSVFQLFGR